MASTNTSAYTIALNDAMKATANAALRKIGWNRKDLDFLINAGLDASNRWIERYVSYLVDPREDQNERLFERAYVLHVVWDEYDRLTVKSERITPDANWDGNLNNEIMQWADDAYDFKVEHGLELSPAIGWSDLVYRDATLLTNVRNRSGFSPSKLGSAKSQQLATLGSRLVPNSALATETIINPEN